MSWRWDQGRLEYFRFDTIRKIASALLSLEGVTINAAGDPIRKPLMDATGLPFDPHHYRVWRNYSRVFKCSLLATHVAGKLKCTELCKLVADEKRTLTVDEYLGYLVPRFYFPFPAFQDYSRTGPQTFPFVAILKLLLSRATSRTPSVSMDEIFSLIIGNKCTGDEPVALYAKLKPVAYKQKPDEYRQVRELVIFLSQFDFLKWENPNLYLDVDPSDQETLDVITNLANPIKKARLSDEEAEILSIGSAAMGAAAITAIDIKSRIYDEDAVFTEGKKVRVIHLRTERSRKLREFFFTANAPPYSCDMCGDNLSRLYPWVERLLEIHHLLPLTSPLHVGTKGTSLKDLVGICPTCHRAVHAYYRAWLRKMNQDDFKSHKEAHDVYAEAKAIITKTAK